MCLRRVKDPLRSFYKTCRTRHRGTNEYKAIYRINSDCIIENNELFLRIMERGCENLAIRMVYRHSGMLAGAASQASSLLCN